MKEKTISMYIDLTNFLTSCNTKRNRLLTGGEALRMKARLHGKREKERESCCGEASRSENEGNTTYTARTHVQKIIYGYRLEFTSAKAIMHAQKRVRSNCG